MGVIVEELLFQNVYFLRRTNVRRFFFINLFHYFTYMDEQEMEVIYICDISRRLISLVTTMLP